MTCEISSHEGPLQYKSRFFRANQNPLGTSPLSSRGLPQTALACPGIAKNAAKKRARASRGSRLRPPALSKPGQKPVCQAGGKPVEPNQRLAAQRQDHLVAAPLHGPDGGSGHDRCRHWSSAFMTTRRPVLDQMVEEVAVRGAGTDQKHIDSTRRQFRTKRIAPTVQGKFAGAVLALERYRPVAQDAADVDNDRVDSELQQRQ